MYLSKLTSMDTLVKDLFGSVGDKARCLNIRLNKGSILITLITIMKVIFHSIIIITFWQLEFQEQPIKILKNIHVKINKC